MFRDLKREMVGRCRRELVLFIFAVGVLAALIAPGALSRAQAGGRRVEGVQPYSLSQPRVPALLRPPDGGRPLTWESEFRKQPSFRFSCFLDTGASRLMLSVSTRGRLDVKPTGQTITDWGIGGTEEFGVSEPYRICVADTDADTSNEEYFQHCIGCIFQLRRKSPNMEGAMSGEMSKVLDDTAGGLGISPDELMQMFAPRMNIVGTPFLQRHVAFLDPRPLKEMYGAVLQMMQGMSGGGSREEKGPGGRLDSLFRLLEHSSVGGGTGQIGVDISPADASYSPPAITVPLRMRNMEEEPLPVTQARVPFVPNATLHNGGRSLQLDLLLDTGGAISLVSRDVARELGVELGQPRFRAPVLGIGGEGTTELKGYWLDRLRVPTRSGEPLVFEKVPFFVVDIDRLEGTLGMNLLLPSAYMNMDVQQMQKNPLGLLGSLESGPMPFRRIIIDLPHRRLGLEPARQEGRTN